MKTCLLCGTDCPNDAATCHACGEGTFAPSESAAHPEAEGGEEHAEHAEHAAKAPRIRKRS